MKYLKIVGHRANSLRKLLRYILEDIDSIEVDVSYDLKIGKPIIRHPPEHGRKFKISTEGRGWLSKVYSTLYLQGYIHLDKFLNIIDEYLYDKLEYIILDIKHDVRYIDISDLLLDYSYSFKLIVTSKDHEYISQIKESNKLIKFITITEKLYNPKSYIDNLQVDGVSLDYRYADNYSIYTYKLNGLKTALWTVNNPKAITDFDMKYVDMIISDYPYRIKTYLEEIE